MVMLFRRFRKDKGNGKDESAAEDAHSGDAPQAAPDHSTTSPTGEGSASGEASSAASLEANAAGVAEVESSAGPPATGPIPETTATVVSRPAYTHCFLCGSSLEGSTCPTCRMTWVE